MQTVTLQMSDSVAEHVMYFLRQLPKKEIKIVKAQPSAEEKIAQKVSKALEEIKRGEARPISELLNEI
ncbi:hypothetical protein [Sulfuricurvum sp.]|uniref:hypothetical protein n=1 Tax=Sulfuricurvum sp. TaxID=2025608 RepID=UPI003BB53172